MKLFLMNFFALVAMVMFGMRAFSSEDRSGYRESDSSSKASQSETKLVGKDAGVFRCLK